MSKLAAWTIFKGVTKGEIEAFNAAEALTYDEAIEYQAHVEQLNLELAEAIIEVQNEGASLLNDHPVAQRLEITPAHHYTAEDYRELVTVFEGSKHEKLHLTAFFRVQNTELMFELVKPAA
jgi:hypothetical protein